MLAEEIPSVRLIYIINRRETNYKFILFIFLIINHEQWLQKYVDKISKLNVFEESKQPNHVLINEYLSGQGIMVSNECRKLKDYVNVVKYI